MEVGHSGHLVMVGIILQIEENDVSLWYTMQCAVVFVVVFCLFFFFTLYPLSAPYPYFLVS